ncbi:hypothetical protein [Nostoc sp. DedQUE03]|uniref:hypothetical protein n=1 Tax=Nostoc sp. DedQUE03 TaxID=3075389 RepID=UPI002AD890FC|nr:hypothetical protein [Nostoc sp. DedQUE03]MDZ8046231.1 hypothetical protein [Nostoc sp. DedQUE02]
MLQKPLPNPLVGLFVVGLVLQPMASHSQTVTYSLNANLFKLSLVISQVRPGGSCEANDNLSLFADTFISTCCKASIRREFPSQYLNSYLEDIKNDKSAPGKRAWKLLNDGRFKK